MITISSTAKKSTIPPLVKISDVALVLSVSRQTVHSLILSGDLNAAKISASKCDRRHLRVTRKSLFEFYKKRFGHSPNRALENPFES